MPDIGPYEAQWNLRPRIEAIRAEAKALRQQNVEAYQAKATELGIQRDRLAREQYGIEQSAKSADIQVGVETKEVERIRAVIAKAESGASAAEQRGDLAKAQEDRENIAGWRGELATHEARARQAMLDAAELREKAAAIDRERVELLVEREDVGTRAGKVEGELDKMEQQADLYAQARLKYAEADLAGDDIPRRAALELEAEALVKRAGAVEVDRDLIRLVVPDLPETTPGIDAEPGPLPPGAGDELSMGESTADDANESVAADIGDADIGQPEETAVHAADDDVLGIDAMAETANTGMVDGGPLGEELGAIDFSFEPDAHTGPLGPPVEFPSESFEIAAGAEPFPSRAIPIEQDSSAGSDFAPPSEEDVDLGVVADTFETESLES